MKFAHFLCRCLQVKQPCLERVLASLPFFPPAAGDLSPVRSAGILQIESALMRRVDDNEVL